MVREGFGIVELCRCNPIYLKHTFLAAETKDVGKEASKIVAQTG